MSRRRFSFFGGLLILILLFWVGLLGYTAYTWSDLTPEQRQQILDALNNASDAVGDDD
jgi:hypothetical protein